MVDSLRSDDPLTDMSVEAQIVIWKGELAMIELLLSGAYRPRRLPKPKRNELLADHKRVSAQIVQLEALSES